MHSLTQKQRYVEQSDRRSAIFDTRASCLVNLSLYLFHPLLTSFTSTLAPLRRNNPHRSA